MMSMFDEPWFSKVTKPVRYTGGEINAVRKDPESVELSVVLAFPDVYEVGMSHLGLKILYSILNGLDWAAAERVFSPWIDLEEEMRRRRLPLTSLESERPVAGFDIVGFSLQHELCYTNVLNMLDLAGIPLLSSERTGQGPLVVAGGPACFNPEPMADFIDLFVIGDGEAVTVEICSVVREAKREGMRDRRELLARLRRLRGVYIPSFFSVRYSPDGRIDEIRPSRPDYTHVEKAVLHDLAASPFPTAQVIPFAELVHDRLAIEISRGCTRGCRFCQAGMIYRPVRERSPQSILHIAEEAIRRTGYADISLLSLSSGDYGCIVPLLKTLMDRQEREKVAVSLPSLRVDSLSSPIIKEVKRVRKTGFTLAPEAGSDRLRRIINKGITREEILETARLVYQAGWKLIKLYFMIGLPLEEQGDVVEIVRLGREIARMNGGKRGRAGLNLSVGTFVPKSHTPFMWAPQIPPDEARRRIQVIRDGLRGNPVRVKWNEPELSWLEGIFSRGDRRLGSALMEAWKAGATFDAWTERFQPNIWREAFRRCDLDPHFYLHRNRPLDEIMPWDHIRSGVSKGFLRMEWERAQKGQFTPDCRATCLECGVCNHQTLDPVLIRPDELPFPKSYGLQQSADSERLSVRLSFSKTGHARYMSHLDLVRVFVRAMKRAGITLVYSQGFHPMPKISFASALPVGLESLHETADVEISKDEDHATLVDRLNRQLPEGVRVSTAEAIPAGKKALKLTESHFILTLDDIMWDEEKLRRFLEAESFPVTKVTPKGETRVDARPLVKGIAPLSAGRLRLILRHLQGPELKPAEILKAVFSLTDDQTRETRVLKTRQVFT